VYGSSSVTIAEQDVVHNIMNLQDADENVLMVVV
jgi:hypothetical protein